MLHYDFVKNILLQNELILYNLVNTFDAFQTSIC